MDDTIEHPINTDYIGRKQYGSSEEVPYIYKPHFHCRKRIAVKVLNKMARNWAMRQPMQYMNVKRIVMDNTKSARGL